MQFNNTKYRSKYKYIYNSTLSDNKSLIYYRFSGCSLINTSPELLCAYTRLCSGVRGKIKQFLSDKLTLKKNGIYINSNVKMIPVSYKSPESSIIYSGSMRNMIGSLRFIDGEYGEIKYNIFGIKVNNMYLIMSSVLWEMREMIQFILT